MAQLKRVAISGVGVISPGAIGRDALDALLASGESAVAEITRFDTSAYGSHRAALVTDFRPKDFINPMRMRRMNALSRLGMAAAKLAIGDAKLAERGYDRRDIGVAIGTMFGPVQTSLDYMSEYVEKGASLAPPQLFAESVANAPGSHIAIENGFEGFNLTFTQRESSSAAALMYASSQILKGAVRSAVLAGVDEMNETAFGVLARAGALASATADASEELRPFDARRNGLVVGEGSAALVLEAEPADGTAHGYVAGFGVSRDTTATISDWGTGVSAVVRAMRDAIDDAELQVGDIDAVYASANSSVRGDRLEWQAIQELFGNAVPPVVAAKAYFGEYAAAGALQIVAASAALRTGLLPATPGFAQGEGAMRFRPTAVATEARVRHVLVNTLSAGGGIVCLVLARDPA